MSRLSKNLSVNYDQIASYIGYPCIFCELPEDAANNLLRLIRNKQCGYTQEQDFWSSNLQIILDGNFDLLEFNKFGASFSKDEWRKILQKVIKGLKDF